MKREGQKNIKAFFSPDCTQTQKVLEEPSVLEYKLMHVDGLSRTEARHMALAMKASLGDKIKNEPDMGKTNGRDLKGVPDMLVAPYC